MTRTSLVGNQFSAADIMMGFTLAAGQPLGVIDAQMPHLAAYAERLLNRPALQKVLALSAD